MKIVLLNQYYAPAEAATAQLLQDLARHLVSRGHSVHVICSRRSYPDPSQLYPARESDEGVEVHRAWTTGFGRTSLPGRAIDYALFLLGALRLLLLLRGADVVVSLTTPPLLASLAVVAGRIRGTRTVSWVMDVYPELAFELGVLRRRSLAGRLFRIISRLTLERSDAVVALGESMAERLRESGAASVEVIHNWADGEAIVPAPIAGHALRKAWGWSERFVVLYSGNLGLAHEFETIVDAAETLRDDPRMLFAFIGSGPRLADVERDVASRGLTNFEFRAPVSRAMLGDSLTAGDLHLLSLRSGVGGLVVSSKLYGILAAGRPTIYVGPVHSEAYETIGLEGCGTAIVPGDGAALARALRDYADDPERRRREGERARALFDERYSAAHGLEAHARLLESLSSRRN